MKPSLYIEKILTDSLGIELSSMGKGFLERTLEGLVKKSGCPSLEEYAARLQSLPEEAEKIIEAAVVPETWFFRDHGPFAYLRHYLGERGRQKTGKEKTRILSVPCSTGEEPYSIVITLLEAGMAPDEFAVDAVDVSENALQIAREGRYGRGSFRGGAGEMGRRYCHEAAGMVRLSDQVVSRVRFFRDNLLRPAALAELPTYDVVFCRNLLIYLHMQAKETAFANIDRLLRPGGVLIAGHAEVLFWRQRGYLLVDHPRSFALKKPVLNEKRSRPFTSGPAPAVRETPSRRPGAGAGCFPGAGKAPSPVAPLEAFVGSDREGGGQPVETAAIPRQVVAAAGNVLHRESNKDASPPGCMHRARSLADRGEMEEALSLCRRHLATEPPSAEVYYLMGLIHESRQRAGEAEECYRKALYLDPDHYETLLHAGLMYERRHDHEQARLFKRRLGRIERQRQNIYGSGHNSAGEGQ
jgi:chemotaxis protein methyltransferase WspC